MQNNHDVMYRDAICAYTYVIRRLSSFIRTVSSFFRYAIDASWRRVKSRVHARPPPLFVTSRRAYYALHEREKWPRFAIDNTGWPSVLREHVLNTGGRKRRSNNGVFRRCPCRVKHGGVKRVTWPRYTVYLDPFNLSYRNYPLSILLCMAYCVACMAFALSPVFD